jgi:3-oxoacyl-[acyl-carrier-protein] synthase-3
VELIWPLTLAGLGAGVPRRVVENHEIEESLGIPRGWIEARTGIRRRHFAGEGEDTLTFALDASRDALDAAGLEPADLDLIIVATCTPARPIPTTACLLHQELGCTGIPAFDIGAACSGFVFGLVTTAGLMTSGQYRHALVVGSETLTTVTNPADAALASLLADGAGAAVVSMEGDGASGIVDYFLGSDGSLSSLLTVRAGGSARPPTAETVARGDHYLRMKGKGVSRFALTALPEMISGAFERSGIGADEIALIVPHQMNLRLIDSVAERLGIPREKFALNLDEYGNTSAASIPLALNDAWREGRVRRGDLVLLLGLGAGVTWGSVLLRW